MPSLPSAQSLDISIKSINAHFTKEDQKHFPRNWDAQLVLRHRNPGQHDESQLCNDQANKLRALFRRRAADKTASFTVGAADSIMAHSMGEAGFETLYLSGAVSSLTDVPTFEPSADLADYTYDTVPKKCLSIINNQLHQARLDVVRAHTGTLEDSKKGIDRLVPFVADADSGHGNPTATMKMVKMFVEAGVAAIHLDDLLSGEKNFSAGSMAHVIVPIGEQIRRLLAAKLQLDIMGSDMILISRTDAESADHITATYDPRDRPYILGVTNPSTISFVRAMKGVAPKGFERIELGLAWETEAKLTTLDDAVKAASTPAQFDEFVAKSKNMTVSEAKRVAEELSIKFFWDYEAARNGKGWYRYLGNVDSAIMRAVASGPYADMVWSCAPGYLRPAVETYAAAIQKAMPGKWMGYNWSFGFQVNDPTDEQIKAFIGELGQLGYVWQFSPMAGMYGYATTFDHFARAVQKDGMLGYLNVALRDGAKRDISVLKWYGQAGEMSDSLTDAVQI